MAAPIAVDPSGHHRFVALRFAGLAALTLIGVVAALVSPVALRAPRAVVAAWAAVLATVCLATAASPDPLYSVLGDTTRMMGASTYVVLLGVFVVGVVASPRWNVVANALFVGGAVVVVGGVAQMSGALEHAGRVTSTMGNAGFLGAYLCVLLPLVAARVLSDAASRAWSVPLAAGAVVVLVGTGTRGAWIGVSIGLAIVAAPHLRGHRLLVVAAMVGVVAVAVVAPVGQRGEPGAPGTARGRIDTWRVSVHAVAARPVLGWGPEGLRDGFARHMDQAYVQAYGLEQVPDRAHNRFLDTAGAAGILGLACDVALIVFVALALRSRLRVVDGPQRIFVLGVAGAFAAWLAQGQFLFDTFDIAAIVWVLVGIAITSNDGAVIRLRRGPVSVVAAVLAAVTWFGADGVVADRKLQAASGRAAHDSYARLAAVVHLRPRSLDAYVLAGLVARSSHDPMLMRRAHVLLRGWKDDEVILADVRLLEVLGAETHDARVLRRASAEAAALARRRPNDVRVDEVVERLKRLEPFTA